MNDNRPQSDTLSRRTAIRLLTTSSIAFALSGCGSGSRNTTAQELQLPTGRLGDIMQFTSTTDKSVYAPGETVTVTFTMKNIWKQDIEIHHAPLEADIRVRRASDGAILWLWSFDKAVHSNPNPFTLPPGGWYPSIFTWDQKDQQGNAVPIGDYVIEAWSYIAPNEGLWASLSPQEESILDGAPLLHITIR